MFGFGRVPVGWLACNGGTVPISEYDVLFTLLGTTYGGDGSSTFGIPDLRGCVPIHQGNGPNLTLRIIGQRGGSEGVTLTQAQMPAHGHVVQASSTPATVVTPGSQYVTATVENDNLYLSDVSGLTPNILDSQSVGNAGGSNAHDNMMPSLTVSYCIAWAGIFPSRN